MACSVVWGQENRDPPSLSRLRKDLRSDFYPVRQQAAEWLERLTQDPARARQLREEWAKLRQQGDVPAISQVPWPLTPEEAALLDEAASPSISLNREEADSLMGRLVSNEFGHRELARRTLNLAAGDAQNLPPLMAALHARLGTPELSPATRNVLEEMWTSAVEAWCAAEQPPLDFLDRLSPAALVQHLERLSLVRQERRSPDEKVNQSTLLRELRLLMLRDDWAPRLMEGVEARLSNPEITEDGARLMESLRDDLRPAMAAEIWMEGRLMTVQFLYVGIPQWPDSPGARTSTFFDRIDDDSAHLVNGNTLTPGDYPVGRMFPFEANVPGLAVRAFRVFRLVNLPTPRSRLMYELSLREDMETRLRRHSRTVLQWIESEKRPITDLEIELLAHLDPVEVSRFAIQHMRSVDDEPWNFGRDNPSKHVERFVPTSRHGAICYVLRNMGTFEIAPDLVKLIDEKRIEASDTSSIFHYPWLAALNSAQREPGEASDRWLGTLVSRTDPLVANTENPPEIGATAAGLLLRRHGFSTARFGLEEVQVPNARFAGIVLLRFTDEDWRHQVLEWWNERQDYLHDSME